MDFKSTVEQNVRVTLAPKTKGGKSAQVDGKPTWEILSGNATIQPAEDGLSAVFVSEDTEGSSTYKVTADADLGEGVRNLEVTGTYTYGPAEANDLGLTTETIEKTPATEG